MCFQSFNHRLHIRRQRCFEVKFFTADRMAEGEGKRMERLTVDEVGNDFLTALPAVRIVIFIITRIPVDSAILKRVAVTVQVVA